MGGRGWVSGRVEGGDGWSWKCKYCGEGMKVVYIGEGCLMLTVGVLKCSVESLELRMHAPATADDEPAREQKFLVFVVSYESWLQHKHAGDSAYVSRHVIASMDRSRH